MYKIHVKTYKPKRYGLRYVRGDDLRPSREGRPSEARKCLSAYTKLPEREVSTHHAEGEEEIGLKSFTGWNPDVGSRQVLDDPLYFMVDLFKALPFHHR